MNRFKVVLIDKWEKKIGRGEVTVRFPDPLDERQEITVAGLGDLLVDYVINEKEIQKVEREVMEILKKTMVQKGEIFIVVGEDWNVEGIYLRPDGSLLPLKVAQEIINLCEKALMKYYDVTNWAYIMDEEEEIVGREVIVHLCPSGLINVSVGGWIEVDRRQAFDDGFVAWFNGLFLVEAGGERTKFGGGVEEDYRVLTFDFHLDRDGKVIFEPYIDTM